MGGGFVSNSAVRTSQSAIGRMPPVEKQARHEQVLGGRYRLARRVGSGGMASVYEGEDIHLGRRVAIKVLHPQYEADAGAVSRFEREARSVARLVHPGIVAVYDVGYDGDRHFIVMEYVEGQSVKELLRGGPLSVDRTIDVGAQVARALDYAHQLGVVHRDVKPHNILLTPDGAAKLVDFGIALARDVASLTDGGAILGTAHYLAPEQARGEPATSASDLYQLGVVLYEMATGRPPFEGENAIDIARQHLALEPLPPSRLNSRIPPFLERAILHGMSKDPAQRPPTGAHLSRELLRFDDLGEQPTTLVPRATQSWSSIPQAPSGRSTRRDAATPQTERSDPWPLFLLAVLAAVLVVGLAPLWAAILRAGA